jgi:hypothetical protein
MINAYSQETNGKFRISTSAFMPDTGAQTN